MQVRAQRIVGEEWFPQARGQLGNLRRGVLRDAQEHIDKIGIGINAVQSAGDDQALDYSDISGAEFGPAKEP
jgi:hypothetical protein